ncbi:AAEL012946-PA [Aedes aegypti]|uniref:AAEL012946-PA n=1 Tax=Aedes aegypti TaxID=7159 RepID=Q16KL6_AEDAE|nr:AAEL012946-PA [Aedes aegypti]
MKKASTQLTKKPNLIKRLPSTTLKTDDNQDTKKKQTDLMTKPIPQTVAKKTTPQSSQPVSTRRTELKPKTDTVKQRVITNTKASLTQLKKQSLAPSTTRNVSQPKKPIAGNFNVTVNSPPSTRKPTAEISKVSTSRDRTRTRTLKPEEVTALKQIPHISNEVGKEKPKTPISFDIHFESSKPSSSSSANTKTVNNVAATGNEDDDQYESEFESYESDFESGSSKKSISSSASTRSSCSSESSSSTSSDSSSSSDEEHGKSQTNIEQKLDSGNYDMKMKRLLTVNENGNSFMTEPKLEDNQPDSGMNSGMFENHSASSSTKILQKRYADILEKISFNTMIFELYEDQPAPYEYFVKNYGRPKDVQNYTQTETDTHSSEVQTDNIHLKSAWIQHPPQFSLVCLNNMNADPEAFMKEKLGVSQENFNFENSIVQQNDKFSDFLDNLESNKLPNICKTQLTNTLNYKLDGLRSFLNRSLHAVEAVLVRNTENCDKSVTKILDLNLQTTPFNSTVTSAYYDSKSRHVLLTLHECDVEKSFHRYVISVWDTRNCIRPKVILSCWSIVTCTELIGPIILGGTTDGKTGFYCATPKDRENGDKLPTFQTCWLPTTPPPRGTPGLRCVEVHTHGTSLAIEQVVLRAGWLKEIHPVGNLRYSFHQRSRTTPPLLEAEKRHLISRRRLQLAPS